MYKFPTNKLFKKKIQDIWTEMGEQFLKIKAINERLDNMRAPNVFEDVDYLKKKIKELEERLFKAEGHF